MSTYDFSTLYTTWPHILVEDILINLIEKPSIERALCTLGVATEAHFLLRKHLKNIRHGLVKMYVMR